MYVYTGKRNTGSRIAAHTCCAELPACDALIVHSFAPDRPDAGTPTTMASSAPPPTAWPMVADQWLDAESFEDPPAIGETDMIDTTPCSFTTAQWERLCIIKELLEDVATVLEAHNLPYFLFGGTLLGAYRHGDIIPCQ